MVDIDDELLDAARAVLGTVAVSDTVNEALRSVVGLRRERVVNSLDVLAAAELDVRSQAWR
jgi:Arc/MetJ family transcription regulator